MKTEDRNALLVLARLADDVEGSRHLAPEFEEVAAVVAAAFDAVVLRAASGLGASTAQPATKRTKKAKDAAAPEPAAPAQVLMIEPEVDPVPEPEVDTVEPMSTPEPDVDEGYDLPLDEDDVDLDAAEPGVPVDGDEFTVLPAKECTQAEYDQAAAIITQLAAAGFSEEIKACLRVGGQDRLSLTPRHAVPGVLAALKHVLTEIESAGLSL